MSAPKPGNVIAWLALLGGGNTDRYVRDRDLVLAGYSKRSVGIEPNHVDLVDALTNVPSVEIWDDFEPRTTCTEVTNLRALVQGQGLRTVMPVG